MADGDGLDHANRKLVTLQHCALHRRTITLTCPQCGRVRLIDAVPLWWLFERRGWDDRLPGFHRRLYCSVCRGSPGGPGLRVRPHFQITRDAPEPTHLPYPEERVWKRVVSRYRS